MQESNMKRIVVLSVFVLAVAAAVFAQSTGGSYYVSAAGNDGNDGLSETTAFKTLDHAVDAASDSDRIKTVTVIGTLNQASEGSSTDYVFYLTPLSDHEEPIRVTGIPGASAGRRAVLSARGTEKNGVSVFGLLHSVAIRFEHIEISGSVKTGLEVSLYSDVTLRNSAVVRNNGGTGVVISAPKDEYRDTIRPGMLTIDGGEIRDNADSGVEVGGALTLRSGAITNNKSTAAAGGVFVGLDGLFAMSGGSITGNTASGEGGGVYVASDGSFNQTGGSVSGNRVTRGSIPNIYAEAGATANLPRSASRAPASRPANQEGSISSGTISAADSPLPAPAPARTRRSPPSVDFGFTAHLNLYGQGWHQNLYSLGIPLQLGVELELPFITLDLLGEASAGIGYGNFFEYHLGGMGELYFFDQTIGLGAGLGFYGNDYNLGDMFDSGSSGDTTGTVIAYERPVKSKYYRFALIFRGAFKTTLYGELYDDGNWGFGLMWGGVMTD
jgi:hypothetical protein